MVDFINGMTMVDLETVKLRFSHKDLVLVIGILVAAIIAFTTLVYQDQTGENKQTTTQKRTMNTATSVIVNKLFRETI